MSVEGKAGPPDVSEMHTLKVDNLTYQTTIDDLKAEFGRFGEVGDVYIPRHFGSGDPKGYAFVRFHQLQEAEDAINGMHGQLIDGREIRVQMARNKRPEDPKLHYARGRNDDRGRGGDRGDGGRGYERGGYDRGNGYDRGSYQRSNDYGDRGRDRSRDRSRRSRSRSGDYRGSDSRRRSRSGGRDRDRYHDRDERERYDQHNSSRY